MRKETFNFRYYLKLTWAFFRRFRGTLMISSLLGIAVFFIFRFIFQNYLSTQIIRIGVNGRYNPNELPSSITEMVSDGLTEIGTDGTVKPDLASSWETPDKGKTWIFHLEDNIKWQDDALVTSDTINYEFSDVEVERPDQSTIVFKLKDPYAPFPSVVSKPTFRTGLLGTGKWKVDKITLAGNYVQELVLTNDSDEKNIYKFYPTDDRTKLAFKLGEVDKLIDIIDPSPFENWKTVNIDKSVSPNQAVTIFFNTQDPVLSEKSIRQALVYAIDKRSLGNRALAPVSPDSWAYNPQVKQYTFDPGRSKEIIDDLPNEMKDNLEIKLVTAPALLSTAEKISGFWNDIGVKTVVQVSSIIPEQFQAFLTIYDIPDDPDQYTIWHSTQKNSNISVYSNPRIDKLLEDGRATLDFEERKKIYLDFQRFLLEDLPAGFLYNPTYYTITRK
jgi:peptide/nickel transport system substrate-binding protein